MSDKRESTGESIEPLFVEIMRGCRAERKLRGIRTVRALAQELGTTENYLSAVENGREFPSLRLFLQYLLVNGFDVDVLRKLRISQRVENGSKINRKRAQLVDRIYEANPAQLEFLEAQAKLAAGYGIRRTRRKSTR